MLGNFKLFTDDKEREHYNRHRQAIIQDLMDKICEMETQVRINNTVPFDKRDTLEYRNWERGLNDAIRVMAKYLDDKNYVPNKATWHWDPKHNFLVTVISYILDAIIRKR